MRKRKKGKSFNVSGGGRRGAPSGTTFTLAPSKAKRGGNNARKPVS